MDKEPTQLLREIKEATGWGQIQLGRELGSSQPTVNRILKGKGFCRVPLYQSIVAMHALKCPPPEPPSS